MSLQQQVTWKGIIMITLTVLLMPLAGLGADLEENMIKAAYWGDTIVVKDCLAKGADINAKLERSGWTALMFAASEGHVEILSFLIPGGADVNARSSWGIRLCIEPL